MWIAEYKAYGCFLSSFFSITLISKTSNLTDLKVNTMKKTFIAAGILMSMGAGSAQAGLLTASTDYEIRVIPGDTGGVSCFDFGNCDTTGGSAKVTDNSLTVTGIGSGIGGDGYSAVWGITTDATGDGFTVTSFQQDAYINTSGGTFALRDVAGGAGMSGAIDNAGNMTFDITGRTGIAATFAGSIGEQAWNVDNAPAGDGTGLYDVLTTGTQTANAAGASGAFSLTGVPITGNDIAGYTGELIAAGNIGTAWAFFVDTQYSERYQIEIVQTSAIPVPAAVWLFGSGLLGLVGVARRKKQS